MAFDCDLVPDCADGVPGVAAAEDGRIWAPGAAEALAAGVTDQRFWTAPLLNSYAFANGYERRSIANW